MRNPMPDGNTAALRQHETEMDRAFRRSEELERRIYEVEKDPDFALVREALHRHPDRLEDILWTIWFEEMNAIEQCRNRIEWTIREIVEAEEGQS